MTRTRRHPLAVATVVLCALLASAACSDESSSPPESTAVPTSSSSSAPTTTIPPTTTATTTTLGAGTTTFTTGDGLTSDQILNIDVNEDGTVWTLAGHPDQSVSPARLEGNRWVSHDLPSSAFGDVELLAGPDGTAWAIGKGFLGPVGLWEFDGSSWIVHSDCSEEGLEQGECRRGVTEPVSGAIGGDGAFWTQGFFSAAEGVGCGFLHREEDGWATFPAEPLGDPAEFTGFCGDGTFGPDGRPHALLADGLWRLDVDGWTRRAPGGTDRYRDAMVATWAVGPGDVVWVIRFDQSENVLVWERFDGNAWTTIPLGLEGLANVEIDRECLLAEDPSMDPAEVDAQLADPIDRAFFVNSRLLPLAVDPAGGVWTAIRCGGVSLIDPEDGSTADTLGLAEGLPSLRITDVEVGPEGEVWVATLDGLTRIVR